ncbi:hypothetical protein K461DRAFT_264922 [Myriangium duriaei CBS 260.36]|uniref:Uncharacterized protein n=1 Tax=Myriangium duriaei CBS 260.36 TaxID=1168546 RepID=A0A9P4JFZ7_9PEZI|nr:hypothetical protein K461DRAFT_264922 [Myriangium duriaei CBS 260.36]
MRVKWVESELGREGWNGRDTYNEVQWAATIATTEKREQNRDPRGDHRSDRNRQAGQGSSGQPDGGVIGAAPWHRGIDARCDRAPAPAIGVSSSDGPHSRRFSSQNVVRRVQGEGKGEPKREKATKSPKNHWQSTASSFGPHQLGHASFSLSDLSPCPDYPSGLADLTGLVCL